MAVEVFKLFGSIFVNNDEANKSIAKTDSKARSVAGTLGKGIKTAAKWGTAIVGGAAVAAGGLMKVAQKASDNTDEIDKMSQKLGMSRTAYQEWDYILGQAGVEINSMTTGTKTMTNQIGAALKGGVEAQEIFGKLGISIKELKNMSREDIFGAIIKSLQGMEDSTERAALANKLFGKSGQNLTALFNTSAKSTEELKKKAHELGMIMSDETVTAGVKFHDNLDTLKRTASAMFNSFGSKLLSVGNKIMKRIESALPTISSLMEQMSPVIEQLFNTLLPPLGELGKTLFPLILNLLSSLMPLLGEIANTLTPIFVDLMQMLLPPLIQIIETLLPPLIQIIQSLLPLLQTVFDILSPIIELIVQLVEPIANLISGALAPLIENIAMLLNDLLKPFIPIITQLVGIITETLSPIFELLTPIINAVSEALSPIFELLSSLLEFILPALIPVVQTLAKVFGGVLGSTLEGVKSIVEGLKNVFSGIVDFISGVFTGNWEKAWKGIKKIFKGVWDTFYNIVKVPVNLIIKGINWLWSGVYDAVKGIIDGIGGIAGAIGDVFGQDWHFSMPKEPPLIPELEEGGILKEGQVGFLEGNGDEAVVPLSRNTEWIDKISDKVYTRLRKNDSDNPRPFVENKTERNNNAPTYNVTFNINGVDIHNDNDLRTFAEKLSYILAEFILEKKGAFG